MIQAARNSGPRGQELGLRGGEGRKQGEGWGWGLAALGTREGACLPVCRHQRSTNYRDIPEWGSLLSPRDGSKSGKKNVAFCFKDLSLISSCEEEIKNKKRITQ